MRTPAGKSASIDFDDAFGGHDVGLPAPVDTPDVDRGSTQERMGRAGGQFGGVLGLESQDDSRHGRHGVASPMRCGPMGRTSDGAQAQPDITLVGGHDLQTGGFADECQIALGSVTGKVSGTQLHVLLVDQSDKEDLGVRRPWARRGHVDQGLEESAHGPLGVASAATIDATIADHGFELQGVGRFTDRVEVRCQKDSTADLAPRG
jgi:hypothetical protein